MDSREIESLLNKYWEGETSLEEEAQLRQYFSAGKYPDSLKEVAPLFVYLEQQKEMALDSDFVQQAIRNKPVAPKGKWIQLFTNASRIAAGIIVLVVAIWFVRSEVRKSTPPEIVDTYSDPKLAFEETKRALIIISKSFSKAEHEAKKINLFNEAQQQIKNENLEDSVKDKEL